MTSGDGLLILGAGYIGAALAELALSEGEAVTLADNWHATARRQLDPLARRGARVETADIRNRRQLDRLLERKPRKVYLLAAQASRPLAEREPDYTEETNVAGARRVGEAVAAAAGPALVYASSLNVYGPEPTGEVTPEHPYGPQSDLAHLSKVYAELCLRMLAERAGFDLALLRLGIVYGPGPIVHEAPESQTVVDKFRRLARAGQELPLDDGGRTTIGVAHLDDVAHIMLDAPHERGVSVANVAAEAVTVADVAALARGERPAGGADRSYATPFLYRHALAAYLAGTDT